MKINHATTEDRVYDDLVVRSSSGQDMTIGDIRNERRGILVFVRHFGCIFCRDRVAQTIAEVKHQITDDEFVAIVGNGTTPMAQDFIDTFKLDIPLYTDRLGTVYRALGMERKLGLGPRSWLSAISAFRKGHRQGQVSGDPLQQGGALVFDTDGRVVHSQTDESAGDNVDWHQIGQVLSDIRQRQ